MIALRVFLLHSCVEYDLVNLDTKLLLTVFWFSTPSTKRISLSSPGNVVKINSLPFNCRFD